MMGASTGMPLGFIAELWRPVEAWPGIENVIQRAKARGRTLDDWNLRNATSERLLEEVVNAARAVLYAAQKIEAAVAEVQEWAERDVARPDPDEPKPIYGTRVAHPLLGISVVGDLEGRDRNEGGAEVAHMGKESVESGLVESRAA